MALALPAAPPPARAANASPEEVVVAALGDVEGRVTALRDLLAEVRLHARPAVGVLLGDTVSRATPRRYRLLLDAIERARPDFPVRAVPGNHDRADRGTDGDPYAAHLGPRAWWFQLAACLFVGVDDAEGPLTPESLGVLARSGTDVARIVVFAHQPFHVAGELGQAARLRRRRLEDLRAAIGGRHIDAVVAGHVPLWQEAWDETGTLHVTNGHVRDAEDGEDVPTAALLHVSARGIAVEQVQVPRRVAAGDAVRRLTAATADGAQTAVRAVLRRRRAAAV